MWSSGGIGFVKNPAHLQVSISSPASDIFIIYLILITIITNQVLSLLPSDHQLSPDVHDFLAGRKINKKIV